MTRLPRCVAGLAAAALLAGCAASTTSGPGGPTTGSARNGPARSAPPARWSAPPAGQVVFQLSTGVGGLAPFALALAAVPALTVYGDGRAFTPRVSRAATGAPAGVRQGRVSPADLRRLVYRAALSGLFDGDVDFGQPQVSDLGSTSVTFRPGRAPARQAGAYALEFRDGGSGLAPAQRRHRAVLRALVADLTRAVRPVRGEWLPERVDVTRATGPAVASTPGTAHPWPGPVPAATTTRLDSRCGVADGAAAQLIYRAARANPGIRWTVDGHQELLIVRPVLPGRPGCTG